MTTNYISASQLKAFRKCPKSYWYKYSTDKRGTKIGGGYREFGSEIHQVIDDVLSEDKTLRSRDELEYKFLKRRDELDYDYPDEMNEDSDKCLRNAAKFLSKRKDMEIRDVEVDHKFKISRPDFDQRYRGILDITTDSGIIDWKSGSSIRVDDEKLQAAVYFAAYSNLYGEKPEQIEFVYLKKGEINRHSPGDNEGELWDNMINVSKQLMRAWDEDEWPAYPDPSSCYFCDYQNYCPDSGVGVENLNWSQYP